MNYKKRIQHFIEERNLFALNDKVLVALSGGADSVALFHVLIDLGYKCECAHCNFHLRGEESNRDENFVRALCNEIHIPLHIKHFDTESYAKEKQISIEMAARELRYDWFEELRKETGASVIAVAHHRDDSVETFLLNLIRGTGINGLKGIQAKNRYIVRPLMETSREDILNYLDYLKQDYVTDSTNLQDEYLRNKIRLNLLPIMKEMNPSIMESIQETSQKLSEVANIYNQNRKENLKTSIQTTKEGDTLHIQTILEDSAPLSLLHEWLSPAGFNPSQIKDIHQSLKKEQSGKQFISNEWKLLRDREHLILQHKKIEENVPEISIETMEINNDFILLKDKNIACLDADKVVLPLEIRKWKKGDKFVPFGMKGQKKVSDYLTDKKYSLFQKEKQYVACSEGKIVWLIGERTDDRFKITEKSKRAVILKINS
ncbi:MAG: tRNA lysidine(34) synthetase TilS [Bacteroidaceae bacterium]|nr:tRNA lysidine(34) synthetase TilS [Bacteroidaceae bacterium]